jgi:Ca-activated chloride channel family protein
MVQLLFERKLPLILPLRGFARVAGRPGPLAAAVLAASCAGAAYAGGDPQFASGVSLVEVYATVTDAKGEPIRGLGAGDFIVEEDGRPQDISAFTAGDVPLSVALAIDRSFSMPAKRLQAATSASLGFINGLRPSDQVLVIAIGSETETLAPLSADRGAARAAVEQLRPWGTTPLFDAVLVAVDEIQAAAGRRALILLSDGDDRYSRTAPGDLVEQARRRDVLIYPVSLARTRPPVFAELAAVTGGRSFHAPEARGLVETLHAIGAELRAQYLLGYSPPPESESREGWRSIRVRVKRPDARVRAREGYYGGARRSG